MRVWLDRRKRNRSQVVVWLILWRGIVACQLRHAVGDSALRHWILEAEGRLLSRKQLRFWELILQLPTAEVNRWLADTSREVWDNRVCR